MADGPQGGGLGLAGAAKEAAAAAVGAGSVPQILVESGRAPLEAFVRQTHQPGMEAEVDFGGVSVRLAAELVTSAG
ncbi:hypothetical protein ACFO9E_00050 [Streptomyces maoxianensis]|uniref:Uncharacterized protein n=1 Tax=Streptomyces maoxianensis TaxID=1459942 RepID=A0ABV9FW56_9ACTN